MELRCECGNEYDFYSVTTASFIVDAEGNREEKLDENIHYYCLDCDKEVFMGE